MKLVSNLTNNRRKIKLAMEEAKNGVNPIRAKAKETLMREELVVRSLQLKLKYEGVDPKVIRDEYKTAIERVLSDMKECPVIESGLTKERTHMEAIVQTTEAIIKDLAGATLGGVLSRYFSQLNDLVNVERKIRNI